MSNDHDTQPITVELIPGPDKKTMILLVQSPSSIPPKMLLRTLEEYLGHLKERLSPIIRP